MKKSHLLGAVCTFVIFVFSNAAVAVSFTPLGDLTGGDFSSEAFGVSGDGSAVIGRSISASGVEAFRWTSGGGMVGLGNPPGGINIHTANDVSGDGSVVAGQCLSTSGVEAFRWTSGSGATGLGNLSGGRLALRKNR